MFIMVYGNPIDGFCYVGPFGSHEDAKAYMESEDDRTDCWVADLFAPALESHERLD